MSRYISVCSGIEAASVAWEPLNWQPVAFAEIDRFCCALLSERWPGVPNLGDMMRVDWREWRGKADVLIGGTPCQSFSVAGLRKSLSDTRGNLALEFIRAADAIQPRYIVWENVPGVLSTHDNAFGCFLAGLVGASSAIVPPGRWSRAGVVDGPKRRLCWRILDAQYHGLAQRRERVFVVASSGDGAHPAEILLEWEGVRRDTPPSREAGQGVAGSLAARATAGGGLGTDLDSGGTIAMFGGNNTSGAIEVAPALGAKGGTGHNNFEQEGFIVGALQSEGWNKRTHQSAKAFDTTQVTSAANRSNPQPGDPCHPLAAGAHAPAVAFSSKDHGADAGEIAPTLRAMTHDGSHPNGGGQVAVVVPIDMRQASRGDKMTNNRATGSGGPPGTGIGEDGDPSPTLADSHTPAVAFQESQTGVREYDQSGSLRANGPGHDPVGTRVRDGMAVRRLTPTECEKLQGFPENWTLITYRGKPAADGPRYRSLGNSMAVPVVRWIGKRIADRMAGVA